VERSHRSDDEEFLMIHAERCRGVVEFIERARGAGHLELLQTSLWKRDGRQDTFRSPPFTSKLVPMFFPLTLSPGMVG